MLDFLGDLKRTHLCGELRAADAGSRVVLMGWVNKRRDLGNLIFLDLRDRSGITQVVVTAEAGAEVHEKAAEVRSEFVLAAMGQVKLRDPGTVNKNLPTGEIEVVADELRLLNDCKPLPFTPADTVLANEEVRLKYRYIDLRRAEMQRNIELRHKVAIAIRDHLNAQGFYEIETPFMTRSTPEGARDYLVPSRVYPGEFYALPQSPQLFKQILMISGFDRYFQIVRCFRDEDLRADRQPEFTQIDLEISFARPGMVFHVVEGFLKAAFATIGFELETPFPQMSYDQAIRLYGIDKPDLRLPALAEVNVAFSRENLQGLGLSSSLPLVAVRIPGVGEISRKERDQLRQLYPARLAEQGIKVLDDERRLEKSFPEAMAKVRELSGAEAGDYVVLVGAGTVTLGDGGEGQKPATGADAGVPYRTGSGSAGNAASGRSRLSMRERQVLEGAGQVRLALAQRFADRHKRFEKKGAANDYRLLWVTGFPMFEWDEAEGRWNAAHHPFTSPHEEDMERLESDPGAVRALAYDVVLNGMELGSGSIRIHRQDIQAKIFKALGMSPEEQQARFGFFLEALQYGTPPHGGIALGLDRIVMILAGAESLREVIPFPKTAKAVDLMVDAPTPVSDRQLKELGIRVTKTGQ
ncbi:MAG TPA: aspartate--tRNA ligase [Candidatus Binatia bacterium]|nr:aspartate--tRNA ligase [Candidatus Binatia bacterium]